MPTVNNLPPDGSASWETTTFLGLTLCAVVLFCEFCVTWLSRAKHFLVCVSVYICSWLLNTHSIIIPLSQCKSQLRSAHHVSHSHWQFVHHYYKLITVSQRAYSHACLFTVSAVVILILLLVFPQWSSTGLKRSRRHPQKKTAGSLKAAPRIKLKIISFLHSTST